MRCPRCQHENASSMKFCGECGVRLSAVCSACGTANGPAQKFCGECGAPLGAKARGVDVWGRSVMRISAPDGWRMRTGSLATGLMRRGSGGNEGPRAPHPPRDRLNRRSGKRAEAREHLTTATTMLREMGMRFWLEQAEAETTTLA